MDPTQQFIPPPADATATGAAGATTGLLMPPPQAMNPLINMGAPGMLPPGALLPPHAAAPAAPAGAMIGTTSLPPAMPPPQLNPMMQFPIITDPVILGQLTGFPGDLLANSPSMMAGAQQFLAQRMMQQSMMLQNINQTGMAPVQGLIHPQQMQLMQQQRLQAQIAKAANPKPTNKGKGKPRKETAAANTSTAANGTTSDALNNNTNAPPGTSAPPGVLPVVKEDPGGKILWAKVANSPWWPGKTMEQGKDRSYPPDADPPRPTAIPIRLFGTHEFVWVGSKRALVDWEKGCAQGYSKEGKTSISGDGEAPFARAIEEAETYLKEKTLPDVFYIIPHVEQTGGGRKGIATGGKGRNKRGAGGSAGGHAWKKHAITTASAFEGELGHDFPLPGGVIPGVTAGFLPPGSNAMMAAMAPGFGGLPTNAMNTFFPGSNGSTAPAKVRASRNGPELSVEERAALVFSRKKQRLYELGLVPPTESPFIKGVVAENPNLLNMAKEWEETAPEIMQEAKEYVAKPENSQPPRASVFRIPPPPPVAPAAEQQHPGMTAASIAAMQNQMMMGMMNMPLSLASFV